jgi:hypothetical protein
MGVEKGQIEENEVAAARALAEVNDIDVDPIDKYVLHSLVPCVSRAIAESIIGVRLTKASASERHQRRIAWNISEVAVFSRPVQDSHSVVPQAQLKALYRKAWKEAGGPARCPRLALGHSRYDPVLLKDESGSYYLRPTVALLQSLFAPRKTLSTPGTLFVVVCVARSLTTFV